jgi:uncharacterized membrane protein
MLVNTFHSCDQTVRWFLILLTCCGWQVLWLKHQLKLDMAMRKHKSQASRSCMEAKVAVLVLAFILGFEFDGRWDNSLSLMDDGRVMLCLVN